MDNEVSKANIDRGRSDPSSGVGQEICSADEVQILRGRVSRNYVHLFVSVPPSLSASKLMQYIKGETSRKVLMEFPHIRKKFWGGHIWGRGYFVASSGNVTDEVILEYIESQEKEPQNDGFKISTLHRLIPEVGLQPIHNLPPSGGSS